MKADATRHYSLEEIIKLKEQGKPLVVDFEPQYPMLFTDPKTDSVVQVWPTDVRVTIGHKIGDKVYATTSQFTSSNELIIKTKDGKVLDWKEAVPYYEIILNVLENTSYPNGKEFTKGHVFRKRCISKPGCHFDWGMVSCTNIARLDGGK